MITMVVAGMFDFVVELEFTDNTFQIIWSVVSYNVVNALSEDNSL